MRFGGNVRTFQRHFWNIVGDYDVQSPHDAHQFAVELRRFYFGRWIQRGRHCEQLAGAIRPLTGMNAEQFDVQARLLLLRQRFRELRC
jgi:hypothetical protein